MAFGRRSIAEMFDLDKSVKVVAVSERVDEGSWTVELELRRQSRCPQCGAAGEGTVFYFFRLG